MSIFAEILEPAAVLDVSDINKKVPKLKGNTETFKNEVITAVENVYEKYKNRSKTNNILLNKALEAQQTLSSLKEKAEFISNEDLAKTNQELNKNIKELQNVEFALQVVSHLKTSLQLLESFNTELTLHNYLRCVEIIKELDRRIENIPTDERMEVINVLQLTVKEKHLGLQNDLKNIFTDNIEVKINSERTNFTLKIKKPNEDIKKAMFALYSDTKEIYPLNCLARDLWESFFVSAVDNEVDLEETEDSNFISLTLLIKNTKKRLNYQIIFDNLKKILNFLSKNFSYDISNDLSALGYIGNDIRDNLSELIIKNCLRDTIPSNVEELQRYKVVIEHTKELEGALLDAKIFTSDTTSILEYASNIDVLFINKKCEEYLNSATSIMKKNLHEMVEVGVPYDPDHSLGRDAIDVPQCSISKNVQELLNLCETLLQKAAGASPENCGRLFTTVTNIMLKYRQFVPEFHRQYLATLPQQIALFLNNCLYMAHVLRDWNVKYCIPLKPKLAECSLMDESTQFPLVGLNMFNDYIEGQIKQINEIMEGAQLDGPTLDKLDPKTEKCVRQCLRQQELLRTVWHKVLPYNLYNQNIGTIVDTLCKCIIVAVVKFEDIPAIVAEQLVDVIKLVLTRAPKLFINPKEITLYVPLWYKLNELSFVLNASLIQINDRWADGKGPLALQFEGRELKQLIKALFQNTDRRAAVLAKISEFNIKKN